MRGTSPDDTLMDLLVEDEGRIFTIYFTMSEDNVRKQMALPWVSFCSDAELMTPEGVFFNRIRTPAPTVNSPGCSVSMCATKNW